MIARILLVVILLFDGLAQAQDAATLAKRLDSSPSCDQFLVARNEIGGRVLGPDKCKIISDEKVFDIKGRIFERWELRISGNVEGWAIKEGRRGNYFNDAPDVVFAQSQNSGRRLKGIARYDGGTGHGISLFFPADPKHWNGKLFITAHGAGAYSGVGTLLPRDPRAGFNPLLNANRFVGLLIDKGYAVAHTLRSAQRTGGDVVASLEDGTTHKVNVSTHAGFIADFTKIAENIVQAKLGRKPRKTYFYGFSAGGFLGRLVQYYPGFNRDDDGSPIFDGFLLDDVGGGDWQPVPLVDGKDTLFMTHEDKKRFVPQIDITHLLDVGENDSNLRKKRESAVILKQKGLADKHRLYEIRGLAHIDAGLVFKPDHIVQALDLGGIMDAMIDHLDRWVDRGELPPPTKADLPDLGGGPNKNGAHAKPGIALPEVACPLGVYHIFPPILGDSLRGSQETAFAAFDGVNLEPIDGRGMLIDMNGNGVRDKRENITQAWRRIGLIGQNDSMTQSKYIACVDKAASALAKERLLPAAMVSYYIRKARTRELKRISVKVRRQSFRSLIYPESVS